MADKVAILHQGRLRQFAPPRDILERPADDFVRDFVGRAGLGLKLLGVRKVAERARRDGAGAGEPIDQSASLADALSEMVVRHATLVPVRDEDGAVSGTVALADLVR
jgi:osmoprotectant transport system ATP-binding protein